MNDLGRYFPIHDPNEPLFRIDTRLKIAILLVLVLQTEPCARLIDFLRHLL